MLPIKIIFAFLYDLLLLLAVWFVSAVPFVLWQGESLQTNSNSMLAFQVYLLAVTYVYLTYFWTLNGQTPGLRVWKLRLQRLDGYIMTRHNANVRFLLGILLFPIGWVFLFIANNKNNHRQTLQDKLSSTEIVAQDSQ
jgi:uncharacterized RDD family membrane protein YckC